MKCAILITGELRTPNFSNLYNSIKKFDIFISTYKQYEKQAKKLTNNVILISRNDKCFNKKTIPLTNIYQWWHLNQLLLKYKNTLKTYDVILKIRSDCYFIKPISEEHFSNMDINCFYMNSDHSFYGETSLFYKIYENFYHKILNYYLNKKGKKYFQINYNNLIASYKNIENSNIVYKKEKNINYQKIRRNIITGLLLNTYPTSICKNKLSLDNVDKFIKKIEYYLDNKLEIDNKKYLINSSLKDFGSEKYNFLHVVNNVIIKDFKLPTIGILKI